MISFMSHVRPKFILDSRGRAKGVVLPLAQYRRLLRKIEDLEDAVALDRAEQTSEELVPYAEVHERLKRASKL